MPDIVEQLESLCPRDRRRRDGALCAVAKNVECSLLMRAARTIREQRKEQSDLRAVLQKVVSGRWPPPPEWYFEAQRLLEPVAASEVAEDSGKPGGG